MNVAGRPQSAPLTADGASGTGMAVRVSALLARLSARIQPLITPHSSLSDEDKRRARLLLALLLSTLIVTYIGGTASIVLELADQGVTGVVVFVVAAQVVLTILYFLARTHRWTQAGVLFVFAPGALVSLVVLTSPPEVGTTYWVYYAVLGVVLASLLLSTRQTAIVTVVYLGGILALVIVLPHWTLNMLFDELIFNLAVPLLLIVSANIRNQYQKRILDQIVELEAAEREARVARDEAERANQVKSAFLASMSHELRTPLNAVINFARFVADGDLGPVNTDQTEALGNAIGSAKHLLSLINDVLDMSKIESGTLSLFVEDEVDLIPVLDSAIASGKSLLADKSVEMRTKITPGLPHIRADRQRVFQALLNVLSNACKFTTTGYVELRAYREADRVVFAVEDTGPGIAPEDHALVFEAFKQTKAGLRHGGGTGLGMPITRNLVEAHGGMIWLESAPGEGTTFFISLPVRSDMLTPMERV